MPAYRATKHQLVVQPMKNHLCALGGAFELQNMQSTFNYPTPFNNKQMHRWPDPFLFITFVFVGNTCFTANTI